MRTPIHGPDRANAEERVMWLVTRVSAFGTEVPRSWAAIGRRTPWRTGNPRVSHGGRSVAVSTERRKPGAEGRTLLGPAAIGGPG